ncbi:MAG: HU family DNA-binding protein [bacterium]
MTEGFEEDRVNKKDLINGIAAQAEVNKVEAERMLEAMMSCVTDALARGESVTLVGFGTFDISDRKSRKGVNPQTGEPMEIPATKVATFRAGKALKDAVNAR